MTTTTPRRAKIEKARRALKNSFRAYFHAYRPEHEYIYGRHTLGLIRAFDQISKDLERGVSRHVVINIPYRHGKSDVASRRFPAWHMIRNPDHEVILGCYGADLAKSLSSDCRNVFERSAPMYGLYLDQSSRSKSEWRIRDHKGKFQASGLGGAVTGKGGNLLIVDDYIKGTENAENEKERDKVWTSFLIDFYSRLAPVHAVIIPCTRWHEDDLVGRIERKNTPGQKEYDPKFPQFDVIKYPAMLADGTWLFEERFGKTWYEEQRAMHEGVGMSDYYYNCLFQQDPSPRSGNLLKAENVEFVDRLPDNLRFVRFWDLASTEKERTKPDPDWTSGTKLAFSDGVIYVDDVTKTRENATARNELIVRTSREDGQEVPVGMEVVAAYRDAFTTVRDILYGHAIVHPWTPTKDKVVRATILEPAFEHKKVVAKKASWNKSWQRELIEFPKGRHDDDVDSLVGAYHLARREAGYSPVQELNTI